MQGTSRQECRTHLRTNIFDGDPKQHPKLFGDLSRSRRRLVLADATFLEHYSPHLTDLYDRYRVEYKLVEFGPGEECKSAEAHNLLLDAAHDFRLARGNEADGGETADVWGGGAAHDGGGFFAAVYDRGVNYRFFGGTGTAAWDAGPAWKVAAHWGDHRNGRGAYHPAMDFHFDRTLLKTLDSRCLIESMAEVIKLGVIRDRRLLDLVTALGSELLADKLQGSTPKLADAAETMIDRALRAILAELHKQPLEDRTNKRASWIGHNFPLIELIGRLMHGEAVTLDMLLTLLVQLRRGTLSPVDLALVVRAFRAVGLPLWHPVLERSDVLAESLEITTAHRWGEQQIPVVIRLGQKIGYANDFTRSELMRATADLYEIAQGSSTLIPLSN